MGGDAFFRKGENSLTAEFRRWLTDDLMRAIVLDVQPRAMTRDLFGIETQEHLEALYESVRQGEIIREQLQDAAGDGAKLTALVNAAKTNPHPGIDFMMEFKGEDASVKLLTASERKSVTREIFEAMADVGFLVWKEECPEDFRELREEHTVDELRCEYAGHFEKVAWADLQEMTLNASDERLLDVRAEWIERSNASGIRQWMIDKDREADKRPERQPEQDIDLDR